MIPRRSPVHLVPAAGARPAPGPSASDADGRRVLRQLDRFARPSHRRSWWQLASTLGLLALAVAAIRGLSPGAARWLLVAPIAGLVTRAFVLQHDCGHHSLFRGARLDDAVGTLLSFVTGVPFEPWRTEHAWHHAHQAQLAARGIDRVNSPMTSDEARRAPEQAARRRRLIRVWTVFFLGSFSLMIKRKRLAGFFHYRPGFRWRIADPPAQVRGLRRTLIGHAIWQLSLAAALGPRDYAEVLLPAYLLGAGYGALLFWVQHNFERTYHAGDDWSYYAAGLRGASYLALPQPLAWFSASIGLHHVHHLHPRIPNYRLEEARRAIPELRAVRPLDRRDAGRCFTHVFWDEPRGRMVSFDELGER
jgi:omega-6 fatty acid desaturase (delta-12 desaturase)